MVALLLRGNVGCLRLIVCCKLSAVVENKKPSAETTHLSSEGYRKFDSVLATIIDLPKG